MLTPYENLVIYPVNPATVAGLRRAFFPSAAKDDPPDAALLLDLLTRHRDRLRPLERDTVEMRSWQFLVEQRRQFVNEKTRQKNRLTAQLKLYFAQVLAWFEDIDTELVEGLLRRWPTLEALQRARPATRDGAVVAAATAAVPTLLGLIRVLREGVPGWTNRSARSPPARRTSPCSTRSRPRGRRWRRACGRLSGPAGNATPRPPS